MQDKPNPFCVLGLPVDATTSDIVERGQELSDLGIGEQRLLFRWAMEQLIENPGTRLRHELFEVPGAQYHDGEWRRFERAHHKPPFDAAALAAASAPPTLADFDLVALMDLLLDGLLDVQELDIAPALRHAPFAPGYGESPLEVNDVVFG